MTKLLTRKVQETFEYLHRHAEISWQEKNTTKYLAETLRDLDLTVTTFDDCTGLVAEFGDFSKDLPVIAFRADIDALWQEVDGEFKANHSCGHDAHMAMVLGLVWRLKAQAELSDKVAIKFIFQPAEEVGEGALKMVENGAIEGVDYLFGVHLRPKEETAFGKASPVIVHGATGSYEVEIIGEDAHAARPHKNKNAIELVAEIVQMLNSIHLDPHTPYSAKVTQMVAGGKSTNIIPGNAKFAIDVRAQNNRTMNQLKTEIESILKALETLYDIEINIVAEDHVPAARINKEAINIMKSAISKVLGPENTDGPLLTPGGDDFHNYTIKSPQLKATMLGLGCDLQPGLHHPQMTFNHEALENGVDILYEVVNEIYHL